MPSQDNSLWTWGDNQFGQLGYGKESDNIGTFPQKYWMVADVIAAQSAYALMLDYSVLMGFKRIRSIGKKFRNRYISRIVMDNIKELSSIDSHTYLDNTGYLYGWL